VLDYGILNFGFYQPFKAEFPPVSNIILAQVTAAWEGTIGNGDNCSGIANSIYVRQIQLCSKYLYYSYNSL